MPGSIRVVNLRSYARGAAEDGVYVGRGRGSVLGNPFSVAEHGRQECLARYRAHLDERLADPGSPEAREIDRLVALHLAGRDLALICWCAPRPCHGEIIRDFVLARAAPAGREAAVETDRRAQPDGPA